MADWDADVRKWVLASEGGYVDHPDDPGGATNLGITKHTLEAWRGHPVSKDDVRALTRSEALEIYKANYWDTVQGDKLPRGLDYAVFDYAVNSGPSKAARDLQRCLDVAVDGVVGVHTLAAARDANPVELIKCLCRRRWKFMKSLSIFSTFGDGWRRRVLGERKGVQADDIGVIDRAVMRALGAANNELVPIPAPKEPAPGKAEPEAAPFWADPKKIAAAAGAAAPVISAVSGLDGPIMWAIAGVIVIAAVGATIYALRRREDAA